MSKTSIHEINPNDVFFYDTSTPSTSSHPPPFPRGSLPPSPSGPFDPTHQIPNLSNSHTWSFLRSQGWDFASADQGIQKGKKCRMRKYHRWRGGGGLFYPSPSPFTSPHQLTPSSSREKSENVGCCSRGLEPGEECLQKQSEVGWVWLQGRKGGG